MRIDRLNKHQNISPVVSSTGGFYNPDLKSGKLGEFYLKAEGIIKSIEVLYKGNIIAVKNPVFKDDFMIRINGNKIIFESKKPTELPDEMLFTFSGEIKDVKNVKVNSWGQGSIFSDFKNYDQTHVPINKSETNLEDDSIVIRDILKSKRKTNRTVRKVANRVEDIYMNFKKNAEKLPESYVDNSIIEGQHCYNCVFFEKLNYCKKWSAEVAPNGWCKSWKEKGIK